MSTSLWKVATRQRTTEAVAEGIAILRGTSDKGQTSDSHQWLVNITLEKE